MANDIIKPKIPGSKSITNRVLIIMALLKQNIVIDNFLESEDTIICKKVLQDLAILKEIGPN